MLEDDEEFVLITPEQASCMIASLFFELLIPCPCEKDAVIIEGATLSGKTARIRIKGEDIRFYGTEEEVKCLEGRCRYADSGRRTGENGGSAPSGGT